MQQSDDLPERDSKTKRKHDMLALQKIGEILVELPAPQLAKIPLDARLADAVNEARRLKSREGIRRQLQYIGKIMRNTEIEPIVEALDKVQTRDQLSKAKFHQVERWRDKLIATGDTALQEFISKYPDTDAQHLRQLLRKAQADAKADTNSGGSTALFRYLLEITSAM
jgi:ribosome-associated protein